MPIAVLLALFALLPGVVCSPSGLLVDVLRAALSLGIQPSKATLKALLACCEDLESRGPHKTPLGLAAGPGFKLDGVGYVDLGQVLAACREALNPSVESVEGVVGGSGVLSSSSGVVVAAEDGGVEARRLAAQLLRTWVFDSTFEYVAGVRAHGPTWPLSKGGVVATEVAGSGAPELQHQQVVGA